QEHGSEDDPDPPGHCDTSLGEHHAPHEGCAGYAPADPVVAADDGPDAVVGAVPVYASLAICHEEGVEVAPGIGGRIASSARFRADPLRRSVLVPRNSAGSAGGGDPRHSRAAAL